MGFAVFCLILKAQQEAGSPGGLRVAIDQERDNETWDKAKPEGLERTPIR